MKNPVLNFPFEWKDQASGLSLVSISKIVLFKAVVPFAFFLMLTITAQFASGATFTVTTLADNQSNGCGFGQCTLREAIEDANLLPDSDTINFQNGLSGTISLTGGHLFIGNSVTINGAGARNLTVSGNNNHRVFVVSGNGITVNINRLTVSNGNAQPILIGATLIGDGGGILNTNGATLNLTEVNVSGNSATSLGGGIATRAILLVTTTTNITRSLISNNSATAGGGGISNVGTDIISSAETTISNTIITNNNALAEGGGVSNTAGTMLLVNNTISHNQSTVAGGGIVNVAGVLVGTVRLRNNILALNNAVVGLNLISSDGLGIFESLRNNMVGNNLDISASFAASVFISNNPQPNINGDFVGSVEIGFQTINPGLGNLANNGGETNSRSLAFNSPAVDRGNNCVVTNNCPTNNLSSALTTDQRGAGFSRPIDGNSDLVSVADIGAFEAQLAPTSANVSINGRVFNEFGNPISKVTVTLTGTSGTVHRAVTNAFGYYGFDNVQSGETYIVAPVHKRYSFTPQAVVITGDMSNFNFTAAQENLRSDAETRTK